MKLLVLIPTRNRGTMACRSARSALEQLAGLPAQLVISDNSSDAADSAAIREFAAAAGDRLTVIRPPQEMDMCHHYEWALGAAAGQCTHVMILTDRMVLKAGALKKLVDIVSAHPDRTLSFNLDEVKDLDVPVTLERKRWSGALAELPSARILQMGSQCEFPDCIPRLLNAVTPFATLHAIRAAFGDICLSVSPDYCSGFRLLNLQERILYLDQSLYIHYGIRRSNGISILRGVASPDSIDFLRFTQSTHPFNCTPYPEFMTVGNAVLHEYCFVRRQPAGARMPEVNMQRYVKMLWQDVACFTDPASRRQAQDQLRKRGHGRFIARRRVSEAIKRNTRAVEQLARTLLRGKNYRPQPLRFDSVEAAFEFDALNPPPRQEGTGHLGKFQPTRML